MKYVSVCRNIIIFPTESSNVSSSEETIISTWKNIQCRRSVFNSGKSVSFSSKLSCTNSHINSYNVFTSGIYVSTTGKYSYKDKVLCFQQWNIQINYQEKQFLTIKGCVFLVGVMYPQQGKIILHAKLCVSTGGKQLLQIKFCVSTSEKIDG